MDKIGPFGAPYPVSPLIRGARWAFLVAGIIYGMIKQKRYEAMEENWREEEAKRKIIRDREKAIMRARIAKEERETVKLLETGKLFEPEEDLLDPKPKPHDPCARKCDDDDDED
ncbi:hypothetical protein B5X24_HaOG216577 [Helicoverpa armigera]|nr:hypothetical protein B5X24_HaOG216577 [Helicoverpa armigera]